MRYFEQVLVIKHLRVISGYCHSFIGIEENVSGLKAAFVEKNYQNLTKLKLIMIT